jgi:hypothetical protein
MIIYTEVLKNVKCSCEVKTSKEMVACSLILHFESDVLSIEVLN